MGIESESCISDLIIAPILPPSGALAGLASQSFHSLCDIPVSILSLKVETPSDRSSHGASLSRIPRAFCITSCSSKLESARLVGK